MSIFSAEKGRSGKKRKAGTVDTLIGSYTEVRGDVLFSGGLHIDGRVKGKVLANAGESASLSVSETGTIDGDVSVPILTVNGQVSGNVYASDRMVLAPNARVDGNVYYNRLEVQAGAEVNGQMVHDPTGEKLPSGVGEGPPNTQPGIKPVAGGDVSELRKKLAS